jgi:acyl-coenzyme A thioesterase PaaI-like protein
MWEFAEVTSEDVARQRRHFEPLAQSVRELIDATLRTEVGDDVVASAQADIEAATARLRGRQRDGTLGVALTPDGEAVSWGNVANGKRNPVAPPLIVQHDSPGRAHLDVKLGAAYEGAPGHLHGGYGALILDHLLGVVASEDNPDTVAATGTISLRYLRPTRLGHVHADAEITSKDGRKIFVVGHLGDAEGVTVKAEGVFITLKR